MRIDRRGVYDGRTAGLESPGEQALADLFRADLRVAESDGGKWNITDVFALKDKAAPIRPPARGTERFGCICPANKGGCL